MIKSAYREDPKECVRIFRPVLQALNVRKATGSLPVFLASFDDLAFLNLDQCSIQFVVSDRIKAPGMFLSKYSKQGLLRAYIILNKNLYNHNSKAMREIRKIAAVHEFIHFIALIYLATVTKTIELCSRLLQRRQVIIDKLWGPNLLDLFYALSQDSSSGCALAELTDVHFRLGFEGPTVNYDILFLHFMFSRELFESYFDQTIQSHFRVLYAVPATRNDAVLLLLRELKRAADDKDVPYDTAKSQLFEWVHAYMR